MAARKWNIMIIPAMFPMTVTKGLREGNTRIFDDVIEGKLTPALKEAMVIEKGHIRSESIRSFREERALLRK